MKDTKVKIYQILTLVFDNIFKIRYQHSISLQIKICFFFSPTYYLLHLTNLTGVYYSL